MSERDELADVFLSIDGPALLDALEVADAILAAGYRKVTNLDASTVERVASVLIEDGRFGVPWEDASEEDRAEAMDKARVLLEAAGYREPRTITTAEELDALPENAVIRDSEPATLQLMDGAWRIPGSNAAWTADYIEFPVTVLWEPKP